MMDRIRRKILKTGAAATAMAAAPRVFAQQTGQGGAAMSFYEKGPVRIHYEEVGSGFPLLLIAGGGLNSTISGLTNPFNPIEEFKGEYRCIASDLRNANTGQSSGPLEIDRPWDAYTDDHLGVMDHLGVNKFMVMGFCIGGPFIWNLLKRAPDRVAAAVLAQPSGWRPEMPTLSYDNNMTGWGPQLVKRRPEITMEMVDKFLTKMYRTNPDFVFTVTRDFVRKCQTPVLILPDDIPAHPYAVAMEAAMLAPNAEVSMFPWRCARSAPSSGRIGPLRLRRRCRCDKAADRRAPERASSALSLSLRRSSPAAARAASDSRFSRPHASRRAVRKTSVRRCTSFPRLVPRSWRRWRLPGHRPARNRDGDAPRRRVQARSRHS